MRPVTFAQQPDPGRVDLLRQDTVVDLRAALESVLVEQDGLSIHEARDAAREAIASTMIDLTRHGKEGMARVQRVAGCLDQLDHERPGKKNARPKWDAPSFSLPPTAADARIGAGRGRIEVELS